MPGQSIGLRKTSTKPPRGEGSITITPENSEFASRVQLLLLYLKPYRWESVHLALTAYEPSRLILPLNLTSAKLDLRQQMQQTIRASQERLLQRGEPEADSCPDWYTVIRDDFKPMERQAGHYPYCAGQCMVSSIVFLLKP